MMNGKQFWKRFCAGFLCAILFLTLLPLPESSADSFEYATPQLIGLEYKNGGLNLTWKAVNGAPGYSVHRKDNGGPWHTLKKGVQGTSYLDTSIDGNVTYTYTVRVSNARGQFVSWYDETGLSYTTSWAYATPVLKNITSTSSSITVSWNAVAGASRYSVHRSDNGGAWHTLTKDATGTSYTDTKVSAGVSYKYTVRVVNSAKRFASDYDAAGLTASIGGSTTWQYATPNMVSVSYNGNDVIVKWNAVTNAPGYSVHRRVNSGAWTTLKKGVTGTSYTDANVAKGNTYTYTVRVTNSKGQFCSDYEAGLSVVVAAASTTWQYGTPVLKSVTNSTSGAKVTWEPVPGATYYSVHRRDNGGAWHTLVKGFKGTSYTDNTAKSGNNYEYTVRVNNTKNQFVSDYQNPGLTISFFPCKTPDFTLESTATGVRISWNAVNGAAKYRVYRMGDYGKHVKVGDTAGTSYIDKNVVSGKTYIYTLRCLDGSGKALSWYIDPGKSITFYGNGIVNKLENGDGMVIVNWKNVSGAATYEVLRRVNGTSEWKSLTKAATGTSWQDTQVVHGTTYDYIVRALDAAGKIVGSYDSNGLTIRYFDPPELIEATVDQEGITVSWNPIVGVSKYQLYRRRAGTSDEWDIIGSTSDLYLVDRNVERGVAYEYTAACMNDAGTALISAKSSRTATSKTWVNTPVLISAELVENTVTIKWNEVENFGGATITDYQILRKTPNTGWNKLATVSYGTTTYADTLGSAVSGTQYTYSVYCLNGSTQISDFDSNGLTITFYEVPPITYIVSRTNGVYMEWNIVDGTGQYFIYRKVADNNWIRIGSTTDRNYTDTTAANAVTYNYAICSADLGEQLLSDHFKTPGAYSTITYFRTPTMLVADNVIGGVYVKWEPLEGISDYKLYRKVNDGAWAELTDVTGNEYTDTSVASGTRYRYTVRALAAGDMVSWHESDGIGTLYLAAPTMDSATASDSGINVVRGDVTGATEYWLYRKHDGEDDTFYRRVAIISKDRRDYTDKSGLQQDQIYVYTVRAVNGDTMSSFYGSGVSAQATKTTN